VSWPCTKQQRSTPSFPKWDCSREDGLIRGTLFMRNLVTEKKEPSFHAQLHVGVTSFKICFTALTPASTDSIIYSVDVLLIHSRSLKVMTTLASRQENISHTLLAKITLICLTLRHNSAHAARSRSFSSFKIWSRKRDKIERSPHPSTRL
jgi:hypothetical protein